jgi:hypothetical protein
MIKDLIKVESRVEYLLTKYPQCRESDKFLWLAYCVTFCDLKFHLGQYELFKIWLMQSDVPVFESLSRARRKIAERKPELASKNKEVRKEEESLVKEWSRS